ncbi:MAG: SCO family protein, partial [Holophagales bacterium]|nr:SCO family protein [Holophagales bacterium]
MTQNPRPAYTDAAKLRRSLRRLLLLLWIFLGAMAVLAVAWRSSRLSDARSAASLPVVKEAPAFSLQNRDGSTVDLARLEGKPWVADFIFTSCPGICPMLTEKMSQLAAELPADEVQLVSFSVDPETDTPEVLQEYAQKRDAGDNWLFLTGPTEEMYSVVREGFLLVLDPAPARSSSAA